MLTFAIIVMIIAVILFVVAHFVSDSDGGWVAGFFGLLFLALASVTFYFAGQKESLGRVAEASMLEDGRIYHLVGQTPVTGTDKQVVVLNHGDDKYLVIWGDKSLPPGSQYLRKGDAPKKTEETNQLVPVEISTPPATMPSGQ